MNYKVKNMSSLNKLFDRFCALISVVFSGLVPDNRKPKPEPTDEPPEEPIEDTTKKPTEETTEDNTQKPTEDTTDDNTQKPTEDTTDDNTQKPTEDTTDDNTQKPTEDATDDNTQKPTENTTDDTTKKPPKNTTDDTTKKPTEETTNDNTQKPISPPGDGGGRRGPKGPNNGKKNPKTKPELICREDQKTHKWEIVLNLPEGFNAEVSQDNTPLKIEENKVSLQNFTDDVTIYQRAKDEKEVIKLFNGGCPLIFKVRKNYQGIGRQVKRVSNGLYVVIAPKDWDRKEMPPVASDQSTDANFSAHFFTSDRNDGFNECDSFFAEKTFFS